MSLFVIRTCWIHAMGTFSIMLLTSGRGFLPRAIVGVSGLVALFLLRNLWRIFNGDHNTGFLLVGLQLGGSGLIVLPSAFTCPQGLGSRSEEHTSELQSR